MFGVNAICGGVASLWGMVVPCASSANSYVRTSGENAVSTVGATAQQTLFNGFQTSNRTRQAESQVFASRETLRTTEQTILLNAVTAYMNLLRDAAILDLQK